MNSFKFTGILRHMACVNHDLDLQLSLCVRLFWFNNSKYQRRHHFDLWDRKKIPLMKNKTKRECKWAGANAFLNFEFSVWCKLVTVIMKGFFRIVVPECCLLKHLWVPDRLHVCSSVGNHPLATKENESLETTPSDSKDEINKASVRAECVSHTLW